MAWPRCPHCGTRELVDGKRAEEVMPAESVVFRSWPCHGCGKILWTAEQVFCDDAPTLHLERKFAFDFQSFQSAAPAHQTPVTSDPRAASVES